MNYERFSYLLSRVSKYYYFHKEQLGARDPMREP